MVRIHGKFTFFGDPNAEDAGWFHPRSEVDTRAARTSRGTLARRLGDVPVHLLQTNQSQLAYAVGVAFPGPGDFDDCVDHDIGDAILSAALQPKSLAHLVEGSAHELKVVWINCSPGERHDGSPDDRKEAIIFGEHWWIQVHKCTFTTM
jgi:hypothetical protein